MFLLFLRTLKKNKLLPMKKVQLFFTLCFFVTSLLQAQKDTDVLMTIEGETILVQEFMEVYNKNIELVQDEGQKELANYIELFID